MSSQNIPRVWLVLGALLLTSTSNSASAQTVPRVVDIAPICTISNYTLYETVFTTEVLSVNDTRSIVVNYDIALPAGATYYHATSAVFVSLQSTDVSYTQAGVESLFEAVIVPEVNIVPGTSFASTTTVLLPDNLPAGEYMVRLGYSPIDNSESAIMNAAYRVSTELARQTVQLPAVSSNSANTLTFPTDTVGINGLHTYIIPESASTTELTLTIRNDLSPIVGLAGRISWQVFAGNYPTASRLLDTKSHEVRLVPGRSRSDVIPLSKTEPVQIVRVVIDTNAGFEVYTYYFTRATHSTYQSPRIETLAINAETGQWETCFVSGRGNGRAPVVHVGVASTTFAATDGTGSVGELSLGARQLAMGVVLENASITARELFVSLRQGDVTFDSFGQNNESAWQQAEQSIASGSATSYFIEILHFNQSKIFYLLIILVASLFGWFIIRRL